MTARPVTLEPALAHLPARHRRAIAKAVGAVGHDPTSIAAVLRDEARLEQIVRELPDEARVAATRLAFQAVDIWSPPGAHEISRRAFYELERHGLALCFESPWSIEFVAPLDLAPALRRIRARAHARRIPDAPAPRRSLPASEQLLHDLAAIGTRIAHGGIQLKADGELYAKAVPKLVQALPPPAVPELALGGERRVGLALALLQELGALRVSWENRPGRNARRELRLGADLVALLAAPFDERAGLTRVLRRRFADLSLIDPLLDELAGRTIALDALGNELTTLFAAARKQLEHAGTPPPGIGLAAVQIRALSGAAAIGLDASGHAVAVTLMPEPPPTADSPPCVAQGDFELVALRPPLPHERAALLLLCESVSGREHVVRITREGISSGARVLSSRDPEQILDRLRALAGELPQNVERSVADWVRRAPPRARLRSAILVDVDEREFGDRVAAELGALLTERLGPGLLAVPADQLSAVATAVRRAGVELEPGLDRVSGRWHDPPSHDDDEPEWWRPTEDDEERAELPAGRLVSGLQQDAKPGWAAQHRRLREPPRITIERDPELDTLLDADEELTSEEMLEDSFEVGTLVELRYAGANGTITEQVTVAELDGARVLVEDPDTGEQRWRWLKGVLDVQPSEFGNS